MVHEVAEQPLGRGIFTLEHVSAEGDAARACLSIHAISQIASRQCSGLQAVLIRIYGARDHGAVELGVVLHADVKALVANQ
jgi:hypothetical protein